MKNSGFENFWRFAILMTLLSVSQCQTYDVTSYPLSNLKCLNENSNVQFKKADLIVLCVHFVPAISGGVSKRLAFEIKVDEYSSLQLKGAYEIYKNQTFNSTLVMQASDNYSTSYPVMYLDRGTTLDVTKNNIIPIFSAVIRFDGGKVKGVEWDNDCYDCTDLCLTTKINSTTTEKNCRILASQCPDAQNSYACDPKIYVSFIGTDSGGNHMYSAGLRISRFRQYSISQMYSSAKNTWDSNYQSATKKWESLTGTSSQTSSTTSTTTSNTTTTSNSTNPVFIDLIKGANTNSTNTTLRSRVLQEYSQPIQYEQKFNNENTKQSQNLIMEFVNKLFQAICNKFQNK